MTSLCPLKETQPKSRTCLEAHLSLSHLSDFTSLLPSGRWGQICTQMVDSPSLPKCVTDTETSGNSGNELHRERERKREVMTK